MKKYIAIVIVTILIAGNVNAMLVGVPNYHCGGQSYYSDENTEYIECKERFEWEREQEREQQEEERKKEAIEKAEQEARERKEYVVNLIEDETENLGDRVEELEVQNKEFEAQNEELSDKVEELEVQNEELSNRITANKRNQDSILWLVRKILEIMNFTQ